ncbi:hypothetical protein ATANTOWER_023063 [Ataeniobius toweri]|uniref:Secreted protein n=1 Tax=Ataeniobius toweri TaxID=208326 RepID=A0ABU7BN41_9TELE|nr:hypothetical protein [Ataeniobius toweri]
MICCLFASIFFRVASQHLSFACDGEDRLMGNTAVFSHVKLFERVVQLTLLRGATSHHCKNNFSLPAGLCNLRLTTDWCSPRAEDHSMREPYGL